MWHHVTRHIDRTQCRRKPRASPRVHFPGNVFRRTDAWPGFPLQEAELRLVRYLPEILALQRDLVKRFQNVSETEYQSIRSFIGSHHEGTGRHHPCLVARRGRCSGAGRSAVGLCTSGGAVVGRRWRGALKKRFV